MGREIRRVPSNWEHPQDDKGHYIPLYDEGRKGALRRWFQEFEQWEAGKHPQQRDSEFWTWESLPDPKTHRPDWDEATATHYQIYETVSEGTPISPVFSSLDELQEWLVGQGFSRKAAAGFAKDGWVPSMISDGKKVYMGIEVYDMVD